MYADDTNFSCRVRYTDKHDHQTDIMNKAKTWYDSNELFLNEEKTTICRFTLGTTKEKTSNKFLGIHIDNQLTWVNHIDYLCEKLSKAVFALRTISAISNKETALTTYYALFHSILSYGILAWGSAAHIHLQRVFILQKAAVRRIVGAKWDDHCEPIFKQLNIMTVFSLIVFENLMYIKSNLSRFQNHSNQHSYDTRGKHYIIQPCQRINKTKTFGITLYNKLPSVLQNLPMALFKKKARMIMQDMCLYSIEEYFGRIEHVSPVYNRYTNLCSFITYIHTL